MKLYLCLFRNKGDDFALLQASRTSDSVAVADAADAVDANVTVTVAVAVTLTVASLFIFHFSFCHVYDLVSVQPMLSGNQALHISVERIPLWIGNKRRQNTCLAI